MLRLAGWSNVSPAEDPQLLPSLPAGETGVWWVSVQEGEAGGVNRVLGEILGLVGTGELAVINFQIGASDAEEWCRDKGEYIQRQL